MSRTRIAVWGPDENLEPHPGRPVARTVRARGCRVKQSPPIPSRVLVATAASERRGRPITKGGRRDILRALQPWVQAYYSSPLATDRQAA